MRRRVGLVVVLLGVLALIAWLVMTTAPEGDPRVSEESVSVPEAAPQEPRVRAQPADADVPPTGEADPAPPTSDGPVARGIVVDSDGSPVPGARIVSHPDDLRAAVAIDGAGDEGSRTFVGGTGADGTFELPLARDGVRLVLTATADEGFGQASVLPDDDSARIELLPWMVLTGRVTDVERFPIPGTTVTVHVLLDSLTGDHAAVADANGEYRIERLPPLGWIGGPQFVGRGRRGWLIAEADGYAPLLLPATRQLQPSSGPDAHLDLVLVRGCTLTGTVIAGDTREPIPDATVVCWSVEGRGAYAGASGIAMMNPWGERPLDETRSGEDGSFRFEHLPANGVHRITSSNGMVGGGTAFGHVAAWKDGFVHGGAPIPVSSDGAELTTTIELWPSAVVEGRVVDPSGAPVRDAGVFVGVESRRPALNGFPDFYAESRTIRQRTDAEGRYRLRTLRASRSEPTTGRLSAYLARSGRHVSSDPVDVTAMAGETVSAPDLVLDMGGQLCARFVIADGSGAPVSGAHVEDRRPMHARRAGLDGRVDWVFSGRLPGPGEPVPPQRVIVRASGFAPQTVEFTPTYGDAVEVHVVMRPGARIAGRVTRADGGSVAGAQIVVADGKRAVEDIFQEGPAVFAMRGRQRALVIYGTALAASDGSFEVLDLPGGPYHVLAEVSSRATAGPGRLPTMLRDVRSEVVAGVEDVVLTIPVDDAPATQRVDLVVSDATGAPVADLVVRAVFGGTHIYAKQVAPTTLRFVSLPVGTGRIDVHARGYVPVALTEVTVEAERPPEPFVVKLSVGTTLRGRVATNGGKLPNGAKLGLRPIDGPAFSGSQSATIAADGAFELSGLTARSYQVFVATTATHRSDADFVPVGSGTLTIAEGQTEAVADFVMQRAGRLEIIARDPRLPPDPFAQRVSTEESRTFGDAARMDVIDSDGRLTASRTPLNRDHHEAITLAPGDYTVQLHLPGEPVRELQVSVSAGESMRAAFEEE